MRNQTRNTNGSANLKKVAVIGAGVMGAGIASHMANARIPCLLLDIVPRELSGDEKAKKLTLNDKEVRNRLAIKGLSTALKSKPAAFFSKKNAEFIEVGNLEDDLEKLKSCDWVIEAVLESLPVKQKLFEKIEPHLSESAIVSSNTSGLCIEEMLTKRSEKFKTNFLVTHFFNPPRYLHLLEIVTGKETAPNLVEKVTAFGEQVLGKGIVYGKDTPNFVANRIGVYSMMEIIRLVSEGSYTIEEVDAVFGPAMGRPKSAVFRTADIVGLDTFAHVAQNCFDNLPKDECHESFKLPAFVTEMAKKGWLGQKSGQGFYKKEGKEIFVIDVKSLEYKPKQKVRIESLGAVRRMESIEEKVNFLVNAEDRAGKLAAKMLALTCVYSANRLFEIADDIVQIDNAMKWGFGWEIGPFESWDAVGVASFSEVIKAQGLKVPAWVGEMLSSNRQSFYETDATGTRNFWDPKAKAAKTLAKKEVHQTLGLLKKNKQNIVKDTSAATLIDLGDGVLSCEFHTKMNAIDGEITQSINDALDLCESGKFDALVLANEGTNFSVGANILLLYMGAQQKEFGQIETMVKSFQDTCTRLQYSRVPTVAAPFQMTLGGGAEVCLGCDKIWAHAELYMGLVEVGVGLIPGGGGTVSMLERSLEGALDTSSFVTEPMIQRAFETVAMAKVATSAEEARDLQFLKPSDGYCMNRSHLLYSAKQAALGMVKAGYLPPFQKKLRLPGKGAMATFEMVLTSMKDGHMISAHDFKIAKKVAHVMTGGDCTPTVPVSRQYLLDLEREAFLSLCGEEKSMARIAYMLENNKPLRN